MQFLNANIAKEVAHSLVMTKQTIVLSKRFSERRRSLLARVTRLSASVQSARAASATVCGSWQGYLDHAG